MSYANRHSAIITPASELEPERPCPLCGSDDWSAETEAHMIAIGGIWIRAVHRECLVRMYGVEVLGHHSKGSRQGMVTNRLAEPLPYCYRIVSHWPELCEMVPMTEAEYWADRRGTTQLELPITEKAA